MTQRDFDVILFGATGFTGQLAALELTRVCQPTFRWALAGRNESKLNTLADTLEGPCPPTGLIVVDGNDQGQVEMMCARGRVLATTAGPFSVHGRHVPYACVKHSTHYTDITGESPWVRDLIDELHEKACEKSVRIVPFCGFDSIPADLGTAHAVAELRRLTGQPCKRVRAAVRFKGGLNGGTMTTALSMARQGRSMEMANPILLNPKTMRSRMWKQHARDIRTPIYDPDFKCWLAPFVMAPINGHVVRRSHALRMESDGEGYGPEFNYQEGLTMKGPLGSAKAYGLTAATAMTLAAMTVGPGRGIMKAFTPAPGQGPSADTIENGFVEYRFLAEGIGGSKVFTAFHAQGDPGNQVTMRALCQSALALALDLEKLPGGTQAGGILSPSVNFGEVVKNRLTSQGFVWTVGEVRT